MNEEILMSISPFVRRARIMQTVDLSGNWTDYDHCITGIIEGEAIFYIENVQYHLVKGDVIIIPPMCRHMIVSRNQSPLMQYIFHFDLFYDKSRADFSDSMSFEDFQKNHTIPESEMLMNHTPLMMHLNSQELLEFQTSFLYLLNEFKDQNPLFLLSMKALCIKILTICLRSQRKTALSITQSSSKVCINVQRAIEYIHRNYDNPELNNEMIAAGIGISCKYLSMLFHKETGKQIHKYLNQVRVEAAQKLALLGTMNITEISYAVGYRSIHTFSKIFKKTTGLTPSDFLRMNLTHVENVYIKNDAMNRPQKLKQLFSQDVIPPQESGP